MDYQSMAKKSQSLVEKVGQVNYTFLSLKDGWINNWFIDSF
jgi:hypothetical protein